MSYTLYGYEGNPRSQIILVTAFLEGVSIELSEVVPRRYVNTDAYAKKFPLARGKIPALEGPNIKLTEVTAIATYISSLSNKTKLFGDNKEQTAEVTQWVSWLNMEFLNIIAKWFLPLVPGLTRPAPFNAQVVQEGKKQSLEVLSQLETHIGSQQFLVGDHLTMADIFFTIYLGRGFQWILDAEFRAQHPNLMQYFNHKNDLECFAKPIIPFKLIDVSTPIEDPYQQKS